jgi:hypothetical protein
LGPLGPPTVDRFRAAFLIFGSARRRLVQPGNKRGQVRYSDRLAMGTADAVRTIELDGDPLYVHSRADLVLGELAADGPHVNREATRLLGHTVASGVLRHRVPAVLPQKLKDLAVSYAEGVRALQLAVH